ncbi:MAG: hypothetical protein ACLFPE_05325 [Bacteroidales bacterium]
MIKKVFLFALIAAIFASCNNAGEQAQDTQQTPAEEVAMITVDDFLAAPDSYVGKEVNIDGTIVHVCKHGGKRMFIIGEDPDERLQVKAGDDIPSFAVELEGSDVLIAGKVDELRIDEPYLTEWENELKANNPESELKIHEGEDGHEHDEGDPEAEMQQIADYRAQLAETGKDHLSFYSIIAKKYEEKK